MPAMGVLLVTFNLYGDEKCSGQVQQWSQGDCRTGCSMVTGVGGITGAPTGCCLSCDPELSMAGCLYKGVLAEHCLAVVVLVLSVAVKNGWAEEAGGGRVWVTLGVCGNLQHYSLEPWRSLTLVVAAVSLHAPGFALQLAAPPTSPSPGPLSPPSSHPRASHPAQAGCRSWREQQRVEMRKAVALGVGLAMSTWQ